MKDYPRWQYAMINGAIEKRKIEHSHHEEPEVWKESPADLVPDVAADSEEAAQLAETAEVVPGDEPNEPAESEPTEVTPEPTPEVEPVVAVKRSKGKSKQKHPAKTEAAPETQA